MNPYIPPRRSSGFSLIEVLVALVVLLIGLLSFASLLIRASKAEMESYQRVQALILMQDITDRIHTNRKVASCYVTPNPTGGSDYVGSGYSGTPACTAGSAEQFRKIFTTHNFAFSQVNEIVYRIPHRAGSE